MSLQQRKKSASKRNYRKYVPNYWYYYDLDNENPWEGTLSSTMFTIRSAVHNTTQHTQSQLVFGKGAILNINQEANWQLIKQRKQA